MWRTFEKSLRSKERYTPFENYPNGANLNSH